MKKHPDNIVFDYKSQKYNANVTNFPTSIGAPKFDVHEIDMSSSVEAKNYFSSKFKEIKLEYERLIDCYNWTKIKPPGKTSPFFIPPFLITSLYILI